MGLKEILEHHVVDHVWSWIALGPLHLPVSRFLLMMVIAAVILLVVFPLVIRSRSAALAPYRSMIEMVVLFVRDEIVLPNLGSKGPGYMPYFATLFFFILIMNLIGLVPYGSTATGNWSVTGGLALTSFVLINFAGMREQGVLGYLGHIVPRGVPGWLYAPLFVIELLSLVTKTVALCVRLFANMVAGHIVILSFISFIFIFGTLGTGVGLAVSPVSVALVLFSLLLEVFVAFLQAYVFVFLTAIFTGMAMHPH